MRLFLHLLTALDPAGREAAAITAAVAEADCQGSTPLLFLQARLGSRLGLDVSPLREKLDRRDAVSNVFLDNLKTATPWGPEGRGRGVPAGPGGAGGPCQRPPHRHPLLQSDEGQREHRGPPDGRLLPAGHRPGPDAGPPERGGGGAGQGPGDGADGDLPVHPRVSGPVRPLADPPGAGRGGGPDGSAALLRQLRGGGRRPCHRWLHAGALRPSTPSGSARRGMCSMPGGAVWPASCSRGWPPTGRASVRRRSRSWESGSSAPTFSPIRARPAHLHPDGQEDPLPAPGAAGAGAELFLHRRRPVPHLPLHCLPSDRERGLPLL